MNNVCEREGEKKHENERNVCVEINDDERKKKGWKWKKKQKNDYDMEFVESLCKWNVRPIRSKNSRKIYRNSAFKS